MESDRIRLWQINHTSGIGIAGILSDIVSYLVCLQYLKDPKAIKSEPGVLSQK
jgi:hypothetical protein